MTAAAIERQLLLEELSMRKAADDKLYIFGKYLVPEHELNWHHKVLADKLQDFSEGKIKNLMVFLPPQTGKALHVDTPILTTKGFKRHGDLKRGDYVFGKDGLPKKVIQCQTPYLKDSCEVYFDTNEVIIAAREHEWEILTSGEDRVSIKGKRKNIGRSVSIRETSKIFDGYNRRKPAIDMPMPISIKSKDNLPIDPYYLGCWLGDGTSACGDITSGLEDIQHYIDQWGHGFVEYTHRNKKSSYRIYTKGATTKLRLMGLLNNKHIPEVYHMASIESRRQLLAGLIDTDGHVDKRGRVELSTIKEELSKDYLRLLRSLGFKAAIHTGNALLNGVFICKSYKVCFSPNVGQFVCRMDRKQNRVNLKPTKDRSDKKRIFIQEVKEIGKQLVSCIQVEGGFYLAGNSLIPTHNSQWSSRYFPAYHLGKNPDAKMILGAYNITFASKFNRDVQRIITGDRYKNVFPDTRLNAKNTVTDATRNYLKNAHIFEVVDRKGYFMTAGIGTGLTGITADIGIIDDPIKDKVEAMSEVYRERLWDWYVNVFKTRLHNDSQQLITLTRWHENDLAGRILEQEGEDWEVVILPAINTDGPSDIDPREVGEVLWPKRHSLERMQKIEDNEPDTFLSLYQQRPTKKGGNIIKESDFQIVNLFELPSGLFDQRVDMTADTAYTAKTDNDPSGLMAYSVFENNLYIWDWSIVRKEFSELVDFVYLYREMHGTPASKVFVEPKASGKSVAQYLRKKTNLNVIEYEMQEGDKTARLYSVEPYISSGRVILVAGKWNKPFIKQVCAFPKDTHDEAVDNLVMAITQGLVRGLRKKRGRKAAIINN